MVSHWKTWHRGVLTHSIPLWSCNHDLVLWVVMAVILSAVQWHLRAEDIYPSTKCRQSCRHLLPLHITLSLHPSLVDAPVGIQGRSHNFPLIHPREVLLAWCWVIARPLSTCGAISLSLPLGVGLTGVGLVHLSCAWWTNTHKGMQVSDTMRRSWLWCRMPDCPHWFITLYKGISITIWCTTSWGSSSHLSLIFLFPLKASAFTKTRSPGFRSFSCSIVSVTGLLPLTGPELPRGQPSIGHRQCLCTPKGGEVKVNREPRPSSKHQIMWTVPGITRLGGIIGMHYLSQVPFCPLPTSWSFSLWFGVISPPAH